MNNIVASINAGFTKVAGQSPSSKAKKTKEKVINLDDLKKVQATPKIKEIVGKIVKYDEPLIQSSEYNNKGKNVEEDNYGKYFDIQV